MASNRNSFSSTKPPNKSDKQRESVHDYMNISSMYSADYNETSMQDREHPPADTPTRIEPQTVRQTHQQQNTEPMDLKNTEVNPSYQHSLPRNTNVSTTRDPTDSLQRNKQREKSPGIDTDWKSRCETLEASLQKFKQQAGRVRELLAEKMADLDRKTQEAESRADKAERRNKELEQCLASGENPPQESRECLQKLEKLVKEKEQEIEDLCTQLSEHRLLRNSEAKVVEEKSNKIKEWVTKKIKDMEQKNKQLSLENSTLKEQVETLRCRIQKLPTATARELHRISVQSSTSSYAESEDFPPPALPKRPSSSIIESVLKNRYSNDFREGTPGREAILTTEAYNPVVRNGIKEIDDIDLEPVYQEVDDNHESKYEPKRMVPPQIKIERKVFPSPHLQTASIISSTAGSEEMLDRSTESEDKTPRTVFGFPPRVGQRYESTTSSCDYNQSPVTLTPKSPRIPLTPYLPQAPPNTPAPTSFPYAQHASNQTVSALATLPRRKGNQKLVPFKPAVYESGPGTKDDTEITRLQRARSPGSAARMGRIKPPTPPMRRLPSWENKIYAIANAGLKIPDVSSTHRESSFPVTEGLDTEQMYEDLAVPVYTTLKGKAAQIRSTPFTGDSSSDSSDNDESTRVTVTPSSEEAVMTIAGPNSSKVTTSIAVRKQVNQTSSGAMKRGVSSHSISSETSSDYAVPPTDEISINGDSSDNSEPEHKLLKYTTEHLKKDSLEKCGYLTKLGGKVKSWRKRWFVVKNGDILYYKSPHDVARKPQGHITLDSQTRIQKTEGAYTFEISSNKKTCYLTAESTEEMDHWIRVLQNVLRKQAADKAFGQSRAKEVIKGYVIKTRNGRSRRCWCVLMGKFFMYYKSPNDKTPLGQLHLKDAKVEEIDRSCDSESDSDDTALPDYTVAIWPTNQGPTYLMLPTKHEKDSWLYHLTVASGGGTGNLGTEYEQTVSKLMEVDGDPGAVYWKHPVLLHTKEPLPKPLTTLPSEDLQERALDLFKSCHLFMSMAMESQQIDYHVTLAQSIIETCLLYPELQNELYCHLIKQTSKHPPQHKSGVQNFLLCGSHSWFLCDASPTSPTNSILDLTQDSKMNPSGHVFIQGWQLMAMCVSLFLPKQSVLWYLKAHLQRNADPRTDMGKYAVFCQRALDRTMHNGGREARPSRMEVMSILLRNPFHHSQPISIPVHFLNGTYQVVSFDGSTTVQEFLLSLNKAITTRECAFSGFSLFTDDPAGQELEHCLKGHLKLCDVISKWEQAFLHHNSQKATLPDSSRTVKLTIKNRLYFKSRVRTETEKEKLLLAYQANEEIVNGRFPLNKDLAIELASLLAQIEYGDFRVMSDISLALPGEPLNSSSSQQIPNIIERFYPKRYRDVSMSEMRYLEQRIGDRWYNLQHRNLQDCVRIYLTVARKWPYFGAKLFSAFVRYQEPNQIWIAAQEDGVSILEYTTLQPISNYDYSDVVTFGGCRDDFLLVVIAKSGSYPGQSESKTDKFLFIMRKPKILELTMLMASYINSRGQNPPKITSVTRMSTSLSQTSEAMSCTNSLRRPSTPTSPKQVFTISKSSTMEV